MFDQPTVANITTRKKLTKGGECDPRFAADPEPHEKQGCERNFQNCPNLASAYGALGGVLMWSGHPKEGRAALEKDIRLDPRNPNMNMYLLNIAISYYLSREYDAAVEAARRGIRTYPDYSNMYRWLAAALGQI